MNGPAIRTRNLFYRYRHADNNALDGMNLKVLRGTMHALLGPNGAGKTTLLSILAGARKPDRGEMNVLGLHSGTIALKRRIAYAPQHPAVAPWLTSHENLQLFASLYGLSRYDGLQRIKQWEQRLGLSKVARQRAQELSGGTLKRLSLCMALIADPELLIVDEVTAGADPHSRETIGTVLRELCDNGKTVLYSTHYLTEVDRFCHDVTMMDMGRAIEVNPVTAYRHDGRCLLEARFLELTGRDLRE